MRKINWKSERKRAIWANIFLFRWDKLIQKRDKTIWVFGGREGHNYEDNSRAFFEWTIANHPEIKCVWLCKDDNVRKVVQAKGYIAYTFNSREGIAVSKKAGVAVYSNGLVDFGFYPRVGGAKIVSLWHGMSFKKIYNGTYSGLSLIAKKCLDRLFSWTYRNITIVTSQYGANWAKEMFTLDPRKIFITGQPRNDTFKSLVKQDVLKNTPIDYRKNIVVFMPTYRKPSMGYNAMTIIVESLYNDEELDTMLSKTNSIFVAKLHPLTPKIPLENRPNFVILDYASVENNQDLLGVADCLVTDYSSCFIDYALLERPIIFYTPDEDKFFQHSETVEPEFYDIEHLCQAKTPGELANLLASSSKAVAQKTNEIYNDPKLNNTCYSENVFNMICQEIGL